MSLELSSLTHQCPAPASMASGFHHFPTMSSITTTTTILLALKSIRSATGVPTNMSVAPSSTWYFSLSPFESIMLGLIVLKLMVLRYMNILPIDVNDLVSSSPTSNWFGRRKRSTDPKIIAQKERLADTMFTVLRRLDMQDCLLRTLCELQIHSLHGYSLPRETKLTLSALSKSAWNREKEAKNKKSNPDLLEERPILTVFEEAVRLGWEASSPNGTDCQERYFICPLNKTEILHHFETVKVINVL